jgi:hypothetical protein
MSLFSKRLEVCIRTLSQYYSSLLVTVWSVDVGLKDIIKNVQTSMLTTRSREGHLHSRAMTPTKNSKYGFIHSEP